MSDMQAPHDQLLELRRSARGACTVPIPTIKEGLAGLPGVQLAPTPTAPPTPGDDGTGAGAGEGPTLTTSRQPADMEAAPAVSLRGDEAPAPPLAPVPGPEATAPVKVDATADAEGDVDEAVDEDAPKVDGVNADALERPPIHAYRGGNDADDDASPARNANLSHSPKLGAVSCCVWATPAPAS